MTLLHGPWRTGRRAPHDGWGMQGTVMRILTRAWMAGAAMAAVLALAASGDDLQQKAVNNPGAFWGVWGAAKTDYVADPRLKGGAAQRVTISPKPAHAWDVGAYVAITKPVQKGDVLLLTFWARAEKPPAGSDLVMLTGRLYEAAPPNAEVTPEVSFLIGKQWKLYYASGTAAKDYPVGSLSAGMVLGTGEQVIDFGPVSVLDFGQGYNINNLPRN